MKFSYQCTTCGSTFPGDKLIYRCPHCSGGNSASTSVGGNDANASAPAGKILKNGFQKGNLATVLDPKELARLSAQTHVTPDDYSPYPIPQKAAFPVGNTPLVISERLRAKYKLPKLIFKQEGANPSGSFKDRASQLVAAQALHFGQNKIVLASTGNAGSAMACAGAAYGLEVYLFVPASAPANKLMQSVLYGAQVIPIEGTYDDAFGLSIAFSEKFGGINRNTGYNPMTIEGKKGVSIELYNQLGERAPDTIYVPVGDGVIFSGVAKGFTDLVDSGRIEKMPKMVCSQSTKSNAISQAWQTGTEQTISPSTRADSISVGSPACGTMAIEAINRSQGWATEISDAEILDAQLELAKEAGLFAEPAAAAAWAACRADALAGKLNPDEEIVVLLTGTGFKDMAAFDGVATIPLSVQPELTAVVESLGESLQ